ncbi:carbonic anhydrase [Sporomusa acidovorans]|uniref:Carbonic anhydrase n=1 Tax=Sporomusa acidovorans (strain ATCC 49682 / DSM 3132 / Mol) TaxID=1123286 RepID=A0ABZ3J4B2_SPOA4|nr:carbonic anhydrase [Sporomusa acidovorans]OZC15592.1 carbonic anhydrase [Sporomusa acidovorans DSM 3132]SDE19108.1 carbonic anhydrase [Sporomusa acidovorans]
MDRLIRVSTKEDIFPEYRETPIGKLVEYHNLRSSHDSYSKAQVLIGMCMDYRKNLRIPENFAYILRSGGGNLRYSEFKVSYCVALGGVKAIALLGHNNCGMVNLYSKKERFIKGLVENAGWNEKAAEEHFMNFAPMYELGNEIDFVISEAVRLKARYPKILVAPLFFNIEDNELYLIKK